jgi:hypothetical protein
MLPTLSSGLTKTQVKVIAQKSIQELLNNGNVLEAAEMISVMETFIKELRSSKEFTEYVRDEVSKYGNNMTNPSGAKIELAETGTKYDYSNCNCDVLKMYEEQLSSLENAIDMRKQFLKSLPPGGIEIVNEDEVLKIYPPNKSSTSSYKITLCK